jgi:hypothetical protein
MDKNARTQARDRITPEGAEIVDGVPFEGLPVDIKDLIDNAISDFCLYECTPPIEDLSKEKQTRWTACCIYVGWNVFKKYKILRSAERGEDGCFIGYDYRKAWAALPVWVYYCVSYNKAPFIYDFGHFIGASYDWIYCRDGEILTPDHARLIKKLKEVQEGGLASLIADGSRNPTGAIAILNHWHGWDANKITIQTDARPALSAVSLPVLGANPAQTVPILETTPQETTQESQ